MAAVEMSDKELKEAEREVQQDFSAWEQKQLVRNERRQRLVNKYPELVTIRAFNIATTGGGMKRAVKDWLRSRREQGRPVEAIE